MKAERFGPEHFGPPLRGAGGRPGHGPGRGPGRHGWGGAGRRRSRVSRGEVRVAILVLLGEGPKHGYQLMQEMEERSGGAWQPSPGSVYPTLQLLADEGLITSQAQDGRNVFTLTGAGQVAQDAIEEPPPWESFGGEGVANLTNLRRAMFQVGAAIRQVASTGTERQVEAALVILTNTRKSIYRVLAADDDEVDG
jgi:DNA-binding PadR family transcriptional regulator